MRGVRQHAAIARRTYLCVVISGAVTHRALTVIPTSAKVRCSPATISARFIAASVINNVLTFCTLKWAAGIVVEARSIASCKRGIQDIAWSTAFRAALTRARISVPGAITRYASNIRARSTRLAGHARLHPTSTRAASLLGKLALEAQVLTGTKFRAAVFLRIPRTIKLRPVFVVPTQLGFVLATVLGIFQGHTITLFVNFRSVLSCLTQIALDAGSIDCLYSSASRRHLFSQFALRVARCTLCL